MAKMSQSMATYTSQSTVEWYTPSELVEPVREFYGGQITLDPASCRRANKIVRAAHWFGPERREFKYRDGLALDWFGNVFLNPPYCGKTPHWVRKAIKQLHDGRGVQIVLLVKSVPGYVWWEQLWRAFPTCMLLNRPRFINENGEQKGVAKQGHSFVYVGDRSEWKRFASDFESLGRVILPG